MASDHLEFVTEVRRQDDLPEDEFIVVMTNGSPDRHGTIIDPDGVNLDAFQRNPVLLFQHDMGSLPIGRVLRYWRDTGGAWLAHIRVDQDTELERIITSKLNGGSLNAVSIGFRPDSKKIKRDGDYIRYEAVEMVELSVVTIGSNREALVVGRDYNTQDLVERHMEQKMEDWETRAGKVLSKSNEECLRSACDLIEKVLASSYKDEKRDTDSDGLQAVMDRLSALEQRLQDLTEAREITINVDSRGGMLDLTDEDIDTLTEEVTCTRVKSNDEDIISAIYKELEESRRERDRDFGRIQISDLDIEDIDFE